MTEPGYGYPPADSGPPPAGYGPLPAPSSPTAITVLVLGIVSIVSLAVCPVLGLVPAIVALSMAGRATREIEGSMGRYSGLGMITAGRITGWITIGLHAVAVIVIVVILVAAYAFGSA